MKLLVVGIALLAAAPAGAQVTTCSTIADKYVNCFTMQPPPLPPPPMQQAQPYAPAPNFSGFANLFGALQARSERRRAEKKAQEEAQINGAARPGVIDRIRAGNCHGAVDYAVLHGTLSFAAEVAEYCQTINPSVPD